MVNGSTTLLDTQSNHDSGNKRIVKSVTDLISQMIIVHTQNSIAHA